jgi:protein-tyrosine-phosphatase
MKSETPGSPMGRKPYVLFMCTHNAARSQLAVARASKKLSRHADPF